MNPVTLHELLNAKEGENLEFKEKKNHLDFDELVEYACAIANRGGGRVVYGISDKRPRQVKWFSNTGRRKHPGRRNSGLISDRTSFPGMMKCGSSSIFGMICSTTKAASLSLT